MRINSRRRGYPNIVGDVGSASDSLLRRSQTEYEPKEGLCRSILELTGTVGIIVATELAATVVDYALKAERAYYLVKGLCTPHNSKPYNSEKDTNPTHEG